MTKYFLKFHQNLKCFVVNIAGFCWICGKSQSRQIISGRQSILQKFPEICISRKLAKFHEFWRKCRKYRCEKITYRYIGIRNTVIPLRKIPVDPGQAHTTLQGRLDGTVKSVLFKDVRWIMRWHETGVVVHHVMLLNRQISPVSIVSPFILSRTRSIISYRRGIFAVGKEERL